MNTQQNREERLWEYIDGYASVEEKTVIEKLLQTDSAWKQAYQELLEVNTILHNSELEAPSLRFSKNVMEEISRLQIAPATRTYINNRIIWGLGIFFVTLILGFIGYGIGQTKWSTDPTSSSSVIDKLGQIDFSNFFNNTWINAFMMINVILGLFLLDNYLSNKRKEYRSKQI
ncbi:MAG TPA: hypothetical protein VFZ42_02765 [Chitinophagaceae bacterium]